MSPYKPRGFTQNASYKMLENWGRNRQLQGQHNTTLWPTNDYRTECHHISEACRLHSPSHSSVVLTLSKGCSKTFILASGGAGDRRKGDTSKILRSHRILRVVRRSGATRSVLHDNNHFTRPRACLRYDESLYNSSEFVPPSARCSVLQRWRAKTRMRSWQRKLEPARPQAFEVLLGFSLDPF